MKNYLINIIKNIINPMAELEKSEKLNKRQFNEIMAIYKNLCADNRVYNNIVWQFPTALIAANGLLFQALEQNLPLILLIISIINFGLIHALFKLAHNQRAITNAMQNIEEYFRKLENKKLLIYIPDFLEGRNEILKWKSASIISWLLLITNIFYFFYSIIRNFPKSIYYFSIIGEYFPNFIK